MDVETWKSIWHAVLIISSVMFYIVVIVVGIKGAGDVKEMVAQMLANRKNTHPSQKIPKGAPK